MGDFLWGGHAHALKDYFFNISFKVKDGIFIRPQAWEKEKSGSPTGIKPMTTQTTGQLHKNSWWTRPFTRFTCSA